jgi:signal transduction histidine kinase
MVEPMAEAMTAIPRETATDTESAPGFEQLLRRSHLRLLLRTLLALSLLFASLLTAFAMSEQTREANQRFLMEIRANAGDLRAVLAGAPQRTVDAVLTQSARGGIVVPIAQLGGRGESRPMFGLIDAHGMLADFGLRISLQQQVPSEYLQWVDRGTRYAPGPLRPLGPVPAHWAAALTVATAEGAIIAEPPGSPLYALPFTEGGLDTLLIPIDRERSVAVVLPRHWMTARDAAIFALLAFLIFWICGLLLLMPPALLIGVWQARREARVLSRPLAHLTRVVEDLNEDDEPPRLTPEGAQETRKLAIAFNRMIERLERAWGELEASRDDLQRTVSAQRELFANVSHDLRTPLTAIATHAEVLERDHSALREIAVIRQEAANLGRLVDDLFELARLESEQLTFDSGPVDVGDALRQVKQAFAAQAWRRGVLLRLAAGLEPRDSGEGVRRNHEGKPLDGLIVVADPQRLNQALSNLVTNAIRHTAAGGYIELDAHADPADDARLRIDVIDSGEGIAESDLPRIFDRTFRSDRARRGGGDRRHAGLGLSIARGLVEAMGGRLDAASVVGEGSRFTIALPRSAPAPSPSTR